MQLSFGKRLSVFLLALTLLLTGGVALQRLQNTPDAPIYALSQLGSRGQEVRAIQQKLKSLGFYSGSVDGIFGAQTRRAVVSFQKSVGLTEDGIAGPRTLLYLGLDDGGSSAANGGYSSSDITLLAKLIAAEARGESYTGQVAVGAVVLNRVRHPSFPDTVAGVIYQRGAFSAVTATPAAESVKMAVGLASTVRG